MEVKFKFEIGQTVSYKDPYSGGKIKTGRIESRRFEQHEHQVKAVEVPEIREGFYYRISGQSQWIAEKLVFDPQAVTVPELLEMFS